MIRALEHSDINKLRTIHEKYYKTEFSFPEFQRHFISAYVVEKNGRIITAGGIRTILECVALTDKSLPVRERYEGLVYILNASRYFAQQGHYNQIHAFVQDENWKNQLISKGFDKTKGQSLVLEV